MLELLDRVASNGPPRNTDISHQIEQEIWEFIKGRIRVLWFYDRGSVVVCTHGFVKDSRKTPKREIESALRVRQQYFAAKRANAIQIEDD